MERSRQHHDARATLGRAIRLAVNKYMGGLNAGIL